MCDVAGEQLITISIKKLDEERDKAFRNGYKAGRILQSERADTDEMKLLKFNNCLPSSGVHSSVAEDTQSTVLHNNHGLSAAEQPARVHGSHHVGLPLTSFHDSEVEPKNRLFVLHKEHANDHP